MQNGKHFAPWKTTEKGEFIDRAGRRCRYDSSWELRRMKELDAEGVNWERHHNIVISYLDQKGDCRRYIPDFVVDRGGKVVIEEIKGYASDLDVLKFAAATEFCVERGWEFLVLRHEHFAPHLAKYRNGVAV